MFSNIFSTRVWRTITSLMPISTQRKGQCQNCGRCCCLPKKCFFLKKNKQGKSYCSIYLIRPLNCRKYPRCAKEHVTAKGCGYYFE